jgi:hypothetical protein
MVSVVARENGRAGGEQQLQLGATMPLDLQLVGAAVVVERDDALRPLPICADTRVHFGAAASKPKGGGIPSSVTGL